MQEFKTYKITVAYDGTSYHGWQRQKGKPSVAQALEDTFAFVFETQIKLLGVSRTDAGVHALGQVAVFKTDLDIDIKTLQWAWSNQLPADIMIRSCQQMPDNFSPHAYIDQKTYFYHFFTERPLPFVSRYGWHVKKDVSHEKLCEALQVFVGTHDFRSFSTGDERGDDTIRTIESISVRRMRRYNAYVIVIKGPKFLRYMIRRLVGAAMAVATRDHLTSDYVQEVLASKNPRHTLPNAPAKGLVLYKIRYTI